MKGEVHILIVGEEQVGKSTLIQAYVTRKFPQTVPSVVTRHQIPASKTADNIKVTIGDTSSQYSNLSVQPIKEADVILLLHDLTRPETLENLSLIWIPRIREVRVNRKVSFLLVGTKADLLPNLDDDSSTSSVSQQMPEVRNIMVLNHDCHYEMKCSAYDIDSIDRVLDYATQTITHPLAPIYICDDERSCFTPEAYQAFRRIFRILDEDGDNLLNDDEFYRVLAYRPNPDQTTYLNTTKQKLFNLDPENIDKNALTFQGFLSWIEDDLREFPQRLPWTILRCHDYDDFDDSLKISIPKNVAEHPDLTVLPPVSFELSYSASKFLRDLAEIAYNENTRPIRDSRGDSDSNSELEECLTVEALKSIFAILPKDIRHPWQSPPSYQVS
jgi:Ras family protein T1